MEELQFSQTGKIWSIEEELQLITEYTSGNDIVEIAIIHKRLPNSIASRLVLLNIIVEKKQARGYLTYKNSEYYQNYLISEKRKDYQEKIKEKTNLQEIEKEQILQCISNIKNDIKELKTSINEIKEMLNSNLTKTM